MFQAQNRETKLVLEKLLCPPRSLWRRAWQDFISQHNTKPARPRLRPIFLVSDPSCPKTDGLRPHNWSGGALWAPSVVRGGALTAQRFFHYFQPSGGLSWHYNIVLLWIKKWKILNPFNLESVTVHLLMLFDVFLVHETKFTIGKWQVVVFTAGKRRDRWLEFDIWGESTSSA